MKKKLKLIVFLFILFSVFEKNIYALECQFHYPDTYKTFFIETNANCINLCTYKDKNTKNMSSIIYYNSLPTNPKMSAIVTVSANINVINNFSMYAYPLDKFQSNSSSDHGSEKKYDVIKNGCPKLAVYDTDKGKRTGYTCFNDDINNCNKKGQKYKTNVKFEKAYYNGSWINYKQTVTKMDFDQESTMNLTYNFNDDFKLTLTGNSLYNVLYKESSLKSLVDGIERNYLNKIKEEYSNKKISNAKAMETYLAKLIAEEYKNNNHKIDQAGQRIAEYYIKFKDENVYDVLKKSSGYQAKFDEFKIQYEKAVMDIYFDTLGYKCINPSDEKFTTDSKGNINTCPGKFDAEILNNFLWKDEEMKDIAEDLDINTKGTEIADAMTEATSGKVYNSFKPLQLETETLEYNCSIFGDVKTKGTTAYYMQLILNILKYAGIVALIGLTIMDFVNATASGDKESFNKALIKAVKRLIYTAVLFLFPIILEFVFELTGLYATGSEDVFCNLQ